MDTARSEIFVIGCSNYGPLRPALQRVWPSSIDVRFSDFDQVIPTLLSPANNVCTPATLAVVVWTQLQYISPTFSSRLEGLDVDTEQIRSEVTEFANAVSTLAEQITLPVLTINWTMPAWSRGLGCADWTSSDGIAPTIAEMNLLLAKQCATHTNVLILDATRWQQRAGVQAWDPKLWMIGKIPVGSAVFEESAHDICTALSCLHGRSRKLIAVDLDNTLWGGIVGDDGWEQLVVGGTDPIGESYLAFQRALKTLQQRGTLLAICSKNDEAVALEALSKHPEMILRADDFVGWRINWQDKAINLSELVGTLNLGLDSVVFIDDDAAERGRVAEAWPDVLVPDWPSDPAQYATHLLQMRCFDHPRTTAEDRTRTQQYQQEQQRQQAQQAAIDLKDWLRRLNLRVQVQALTDSDLARAAQLFNKTNQYNLTTRRMNESQLHNLAAQDNHDVYVYRVDDRFGDYGLTALATLRFEGERAYIDDFLMSCRIMGRGIELAMLHHLSAVARQQHSGTLVAAYCPTAKNKPCATLYQDAGFEPTSDNQWNYTLSEPLAQPDHVELQRT